MKKEIIKKKQVITELKENDYVYDIFVVKFKKPIARYKNGYKFELRLGDTTGEIMLKYWGSADQGAVERLYRSISEDDVIIAEGRVNEYNKALEISSNDESKIEVVSEEQYNKSDFVPVSSKDLDKMMAEIKSHVSSVKDKDIRMILDAFFNDESFVEKFRVAPAGMYKHHGWVGGLAEHTLECVSLVLKYAELYPKLDKDLMVAGAILHDIGKIDELEIKTSIRVSFKGMMEKHISLGYVMFVEMLTEVVVPEEIKTKLGNILLSHHGYFEYGSPVVPATPEAWAVHFADNTSAKLDFLSKLRSEGKDKTDDRFIYNKEFGNVLIR